MKIRDDGDYKEIYGTFKNYIEERWGFNEKQGYRLLNAAELTQKIAQISSRGLTTNGAKTYAKEFQLDLMV